MPVGQVGWIFPMLLSAFASPLRLPRLRKPASASWYLRHRRSEIPEDVMGTAEGVRHAGHERIIQRAGMRQGGCERDGRAPGVAAGQL